MARLNSLFGGLFGEADLRENLERRQQAAIAACNQYSADALLSTPTEDVVAEIHAENAITPLELRWDEAAQLPTEESKVDVSGDYRYAVFDRSKPKYAPAARVRIAVPFEGDVWLFKCRPSSFVMTTIDRVEIGQGEIVLSNEWPNPEPDQVKNWFEGRKSLIAQYVATSANDVRTFMDGLPSAIRKAVDSRKNRLLRDRGLEGSIGLPVRRTSQPPVVVPIRRKQITTTRVKRAKERTSAGAKYEDEPALTESQYEETVKLIVGFGRQLERSPRTSMRWSEEELRDQYLQQLNGYWEGEAGGEVFNGAGKTDILLRSGDRNVFIAECKFWSGAKEFSEAIDQLLGYLVWRDTKAALVLFIRRRNPTDAIDRADETIRGHICFKRDGKATNDPTERRNYVLHHPDDERREILLALIPVVIRTE